MKLGVHLGCLSEAWGGFQYYTYHFVRSLLGQTNHSLVLFHRGPASDLRGLGTSRTQLVRYGLNGPSRVLGEQLLLPASMLTVTDLDRLLVPAYLGPLQAPVPVDLIVYDLLFTRSGTGHSYPEQFYWQSLYQHAFRRADRLFPISRTVRRNLTDRFPELASKLGPVLYPGLREFPPLGRSHATRPEKPYLLFVGAIHPRKNVDGLLAWYQGAPESLRDRYDLRIVGHYGWGRPTPSELEQVGEGVHWHGDVPDRELARLYRGASLFCLPSRGEGFGMPILEAFHHRTPVVLSDLDVFHEVAGPAAHYLPPEAPDAWTDTLQPLLEDPGLRRRQVTRGIRRLRRYSWAKSASRYRMRLEESF